jgi:hypothetical protein
MQSDEHQMLCVPGGSPKQFAAQRDEPAPALFIEPSAADVGILPAPVAEVAINPAR